MACGLDGGLVSHDILNRSEYLRARDVAAVMMRQRCPRCSRCLLIAVRVLVATALYVLFTHMIKLRAKVFGKGRKLNEKKVQ